MLHDIYYIISPDILQQAVKVGDNTIIVLEIELPDKKNGAHPFQLTEKYVTDSPFCLLVHLYNTLTHEQAMDIIAFLFFTNYHKPNGIPQIIVGEENGDLITAGVELLQETARAQGFAAIHITLTSALSTIYSTNDLSAIKEAYRSGLSFAIMKPLFIRVEEPSAIPVTDQALAAEETLFEQEHGSLFMLQQQNRQLLKQVQQLEQLCQAAQQEISNQVSHNQILRSASQATALQNYYNNEYEVLPLWYKRVGHIIKAFMGKRSFKSLFSDKAKKYKD